MLLLKRTSAWDELSNLVDRDEDLGSSDSPFFKLYDAILDAGKEDALDNVISDEFPNGVESGELEDFFINEGDFILEELGIDQPSTDDYHDDDEEGSEEEDYDYDNGED